MTEDHRLRMIDAAYARLSTPAASPEVWKPIGFLRNEQVCWFCGAVLPAMLKPKRGHVVWWWKEKDVWECQGCRVAGLPGRA